jgi:hypothetical protein
MHLMLLLTSSLQIVLAFLGQLQPLEPTRQVQLRQQQMAAQELQQLGDSAAQAHFEVLDRWEWPWQLQNSLHCQLEG